MKFFIILFAAMTTSVLAANPANPAKPAKPAKPAPPADPCVTIRAACTKSCIGEPPVSGPKMMQYSQAYCSIGSF